MTTNPALFVLDRVNAALREGAMRERLEELRTEIAEIEGEEDRLSVRRAMAEAEVRQIEAKLQARRSDDR